MVKLHLQIVASATNLPHIDKFKKWVGVIFDHQGIIERLGGLKPSFKLHLSEITIRIVDEQEMAALNYNYRKKIGPTNVLSFAAENIPMDLAQKYKHYLLGDIVICANIIEKEAVEQNKKLGSHWAHIVIHGVLHLLGYDHQDAATAEEMEGLEIALMKQLGFSSPY